MLIEKFTHSKKKYVRLRFNGQKLMGLHGMYTILYKCAHERTRPNVCAHIRTCTRTQPICFVFILFDEVHSIFQSIYLLLFSCNAHKMHPFLLLLLPLRLFLTLFHSLPSLSLCFFALCAVLCCALVQIGAHIQCTEFIFCFPFIFRLLFY